MLVTLAGPFVQPFVLYYCFRRSGAYCASICTVLFCVLGFSHDNNSMTYTSAKLVSLLHVLVLKILQHARNFGNQALPLFNVQRALKSWEWPGYEATETLHQTSARYHDHNHDFAHACGKLNWMRL